MRDAGQNAVRWFGANTDIHDLKAAEAALRQSQIDSDRAQEVGEIGSWRMDIRRNALAGSDENHRIFGVPKGTALTSETFLAIVHPEDRRYVDTKWQAGLRGEPYDIGHRLVADRQVKWVREKAYLELDNEGKLLGGFGITQDITARKRMEEELRGSRDELEIRVGERTEELAKSQQRLQHLASQLLLAQEKERKRVAAELHDGLMSELAATNFLREGKIMLLDNGKQIDSGDLQRVADILAGTRREARRLMNNLHPSLPDELGLVAAIGWLGGEYQRFYPHILVQKEIGVSEKDISESLKVVIYRVLQAALNNFAKHGKGDRVEVSLSKTDRTFFFVIRDNGQGFDVGNVQKGLGLESMRERVELSGGKFQLDSIIGQGTTIRLIWTFL
jgi:PAS domain S-box-containing protein